MAGTGLICSLTARHGCALQAQQKQVEAENEARQAAWRAACGAIAQQRTAAADAKAAAERDLTVARTQQAAERAQAAIAAAVAAAAEAQDLQVTVLYQPLHWQAMFLQHPSRTELLRQAGSLLIAGLHP